MLEDSEGISFVSSQETSFRGLDENYSPISNDPLSSSPKIVTSIY